MAAESGGTITNGKAMRVIAMPTVLFWKAMTESVTPGMARTVSWQGDAAEKARMRVVPLASCPRHALAVLVGVVGCGGKRRDDLMLIAVSGSLLRGAEVASKSRPVSWC